MEGPTSVPLTTWESFYVIVGSAAAALTGLQFVVTVLGAEFEMWSDSAAKAFGTPTIVHFSVVLLISALLSAPWQTVTTPGLVLTMCGLIGCVYSLRVVWHARQQRDYKPVAQDWVWHCLLPLLAYIVLTWAGIVMRRDALSALFMVAATTVALLFIGIHNAWDSVTYIATERGKSARKKTETNNP